MKKLIALSIAASLFTMAATAQIDRATETSTQQQGRHNKKGDKMKLAKELNLSKEQMAQLKENQKAMKAKVQALKANDQITVKEMNERKAALREEQKANLQKILTAEQFAKFEEMKKNRKAQAKGKFGAEDDMLIP
jgi:Spy/CpxP family protein refolding chaperone